MCVSHTGLEVSRRIFVTWVPQYPPVSAEIFCGVDLSLDFACREGVAAARPPETSKKNRHQDRIGGSLSPIVRIASAKRRAARPDAALSSSIDGIPTPGRCYVISCRGVAKGAALARSLQIQGAAAAFAGTPALCDDRSTSVGGQTMAISSVRCAVLGAIVMRVTDLEGETTKIMCADYEEPTRVCRPRTSVSQGGMLSQFLERISAGSLDPKNMRGDLCAA